MKHIKILILLVLVLLAAKNTDAQAIDNWTQVGMVKYPVNTTTQVTGMGRVSMLVFHPSDSNILFAVSSSGGLWKSGNRGISWHQMTDFLPNTRCASLLINYKNPNTMILGTGDQNYYYSGLGPWKSYDGGKTWFQSNKGMGNVLVSEMIMDPSDTNTIVAATNGGVYKSKDGGASWTSKSVSGMDLFQHILRKPGSKRTLYASSLYDTYVSTDFGDTWTKKKFTNSTTISGTNIAVTPADTNVLYVTAWSTVSNKSYGGLYKSSDGAKSFRLMSDTPQILGYSNNGTASGGQGNYNLALCASPKKAGTLYLGAINIWKSLDSGKTWKQISYWVTGVHADKHHFVYSPFNPQQIYITHDGGIDRNLDTANNTNWTRISDGLSASEFYSFGQSPVKKELMRGGLQDNGVNLYKDKVFYTVKGGDGNNDFVFDNENPRYDYERNTGQRDDDINLTSVAVGTRGIIEPHATDSTIMYCGDYYLLRSKTIRSNKIRFYKISDTLQTGATASMVSISSSRKLNTLLYYSKNPSGFYRTDNALDSLPTYTSLTPPNTSTYVNWVAASPNNASIVYCVQGAKVYRSSNKGSSWADISTGLPGTNVIKILMDPYDKDDGLYALTGFGVYYTNAKMSKFLYFSTSMPSICSFTDMEIFADSTRNSCLRVSTFGRGIWQTSLYRNRALAPLADFTIHSTTAKTCADVYILNDISQGIATSRRWQITPNTGYSYINGTDSTTRNPEIQFTTSGIYYVTLASTNSVGTTYKTQNINYSPLSVAAKCLPYTTNLGYWYLDLLRFEFNTIDNATPETVYSNPDILDYTCNQSTIVKPGTSYKAAITTYTLNDQYTNVYIDYNNNGSFADTGELVASLGPAKGRQIFTIKTQVNPTVKNKFLRMRLMTDFYAIKSSCGPLSYGETQDYTVMIDGSRPTVSISIPKPTVSSTFNASFSTSIPLSDFDSTDVVVSNAVLSNFRQTGPSTYTARVKPINNGKVGVSVKASAMTNLPGAKNDLTTDTTNFFLGIKAFTFSGKSQYDTIKQTATGGEIHCYLPYGFNKDSLIEHFSLSDSSNAYVGSTTQTTDKTMNSFANNLTYKIVAKDTSLSKTYLIKVYTLPDTNCRLLSFGFKSPAATGTITQTTKGGTVKVIVPASTNLSKLIASYTTTKTAHVTANAIAQKSDTTQNDFTNPINYSIIAQDGKHFKIYTVTVSTGKSTACDMKSFKFKGQTDTGKITANSSGGVVIVSVPYGTKTNNLVGIFTISDSAKASVNTISQLSGTTTNDFKDTVVYKVVASDGIHIKYYKVVVKILPNTACYMLHFKYQGLTDTAKITNNATGGILTITVPFGTKVNNLVAIFSLSDSAKAYIKTIIQVSGTTANNYKDTVVYQVIAQDGKTIKYYKVVTSIIPNTACELISFNFTTPTATGTIKKDTTGGIVTLNVPFGTNVKNIVPTFVISDSAKAHVAGVLQLSNVTANDFTDTVRYTINAQDNKHSKLYRVKAIVDKNVGVEHISLKGIDYKVYPNPTDGLLHITASNTNDKHIKASLYNSYGQLMLMHDGIIPANGNITIDMSTYSKGLYLLQLETEDGMVLKKVELQ